MGMGMGMGMDGTLLSGHLHAGPHWAMLSWEILSLGP